MVAMLVVKGGRRGGRAVMNSIDSIDSIDAYKYGWEQ